jgi:hypothetical protein
MLRKGSGWLLATTTTHIPFQNSDTEKGNKQQTQKQKLASCFASSKKIHPFAVNLSTILLQFVNLFVVIVVVVVFAVFVVVFVSLVLCIEELKEVERWRWIV